MCHWLVCEGQCTIHWYHPGTLIRACETLKLSPSSRHSPPEPAENLLVHMHVSSGRKAARSARDTSKFLVPFAVASPSRLRFLQSLDPVERPLPCPRLPPPPSRTCTCCPPLPPGLQALTGRATPQSCLPAGLGAQARLHQQQHGIYQRSLC